jgi:pumilio family protein 6
MAIKSSSSNVTSKRKDGDSKFSSQPSKKSKGSGAKHSTVPPSTVGSKRAVKQERQSQRKHADVVNDAKRIWNQLRLKTNTSEQNRQYMDTLMPLITGKANEIALQHDAARVVQAAIQFGTVEERRLILQELCAKQNNFAELCKSQYAHFCALKAIKYCHSDPASVKLINKALKGHMPRLAVHAVGSRVVQSIFSTMTPKQSAVLKQEFYGPHFALFALDLPRNDAVPTLATNIAEAPEKKEATLIFVRNLINKGMEKTLYGFTYFQDLFAEYCEVADPREIRILAGTAADNSIHLLSGRAGTRVVASLISYGTAKDRKRIMKSLKGYTKSGLLHHDAYLAIIRLVQLTDDTVSIHKNIFNELLLPSDKSDEELSCPLLELALSDTGSKLLLMLLVADPETLKKFFDPYELSVLFENPTVIDDGQEVLTSKKEPEIRRKELIKYLREPLIEMCAKSANELIRSRPGALVLREVYHSYRPISVVEAIVGTCQAALNQDSSKGDEKDVQNYRLFEDRDGHLAVKNLLLADSAKESEAKLASAFFETFQDRLMEIAQSNRGAFVITALCKVLAVRKGAISKLNQAQLKKLADGNGATAGFKALVNEMDGK